jgi:hypothetical protein
LRQGYIRSFARLVRLIGAPAAVARVQAAMAAGKTTNPFAYVEACITGERVRADEAGRVAGGAVAAAGQGDGAAGWQRVAEYLAGKWKFGHEDLTGWLTRYAAADPAKVLDALVQHYNAKPFPPKYHEIDKAVNAGAPAAPARTGETPSVPFVDALKRNNPKLANRTDAEALLLYHRAQWQRSSKDDGARRGALSRAANDLAGLPGWNYEEATRAAESVVADTPALKLAT